MPAQRTLLTPPAAGVVCRESMIRDAGQFFSRGVSPLARCTALGARETRAQLREAPRSALRLVLRAGSSCAHS